MEPLTVRASAKLLLSGEHSVLGGMPAVGIPMPLWLHLSLAPHHSAPFLSPPPVDDWQERAGAQHAGAPHAGAPHASALFSATARELLADHRGFTDTFTRLLRRARANGHTIDLGQLHITSDIPIGAGLGSSAALSVACARLLAHLRDDNQQTRQTQRTVWDVAHRLERHFHGHPSGVDTGVIAADAPLLLRHRHRHRHSHPHRHPPPPPHHDRENKSRYAAPHATTHCSR